MTHTSSRRALLRAAAGGTGLAALSSLIPAVPTWAQAVSPGFTPAMPSLSGEHINLSIGHSPFELNGHRGHAVTVNGSMPAPLIRLREGQNVHLRVTNTLDEDTSIHWHGLLLPFQMDGVPGISFPGIGPGQSFDYRFPVRQSGTYWYHSHSNMQEAMGLLGPLVIDPAGAEPVPYDREHIIVLSDWSFLHPHQILEKLKKSPGYFNHNRTTLQGLMDGSDRMNLEERRMWGQTRMDPRDLLDVNGTTYTYLVNGHGPDAPWTGLVQPGERVRLRIINASAMSIFNVRIPGLPMTVVQADGVDVRPVETDEFQISVAETYDVIIQPGSGPLVLVAEAMDRSGMAVAMLTPHAGHYAEVPPLRDVPNLTMRDMGMGGMDHGGAAAGATDHSGHGAATGQGAMDHSTMDHSAMNHGAMDHSAMGHGSSASSGTMSGMNHGAMGHATATAPAAQDHSGMDHGSMSMRDPNNAPANVSVGVGVDMIAPDPANRLGDRPTGLADVPHRVLVYTDLVALNRNPDAREPERTMEIHLTGNMERFMWGLDGQQFSALVEPIRFGLNERVRVVLVNDTMMNHPIHLHGHFFELVTGAPADRQPMKHTVNVQPGGKLAFDLTADAPGDWAFHCHLLMHMHTGMFNVVTVRPLVEGGAS